MKRILVLVGGVLVLLTWAYGLAFLWCTRPWRTALVVQTHRLTAAEWNARADVWLKHEQASGRTPSRMQALLQTGRNWLLQKLLADEAYTQGFQVTVADEQEGFAHVQAQLQDAQEPTALGQTVRDEDFHEALLINQWLTQEGWARAPELIEQLAHRAHMSCLERVNVLPLTDFHLPQIP